VSRDAASGLNQEIFLALTASDSPRESFGKALAERAPRLIVCQISPGSAALETGGVCESDLSVHDLRIRERIGDFLTQTRIKIGVDILSTR
jgi:hypothetical protein